jgi:hypothetical protein
MKQNEMGGACGTYWGEDRCIRVRKPEGKSHLEDLSVDGKVILNVS